MVQIKSFRGIRPDKLLAKDIASLPYDVLNSEEARELVQNNPHSYLHIDKSEIDLDPNVPPYNLSVYEKAKENLTLFLDKGWLKKEKKDCLYLYELTMNGFSQLGLVTCTSIDDYLNGDIKKHELTRKEKELDRIQHITYCNANTSPIFLTYRENTTINDITQQWIQEHDVEYDFVHSYEVRHKVWVIDDQIVIDQLVQLFKEDVPSLYIADGHHRTESAVKVGLNRRNQIGDTPDAPYQSFLSVLFPKNELHIYDYNRILTLTVTEEHLERIANYFYIAPKGKKTYKPKKSHEFSMYYQGEWQQLILKEKFLIKEKGTLKLLSAALFQKYIAEKCFNITDIRTNQQIDFIGGIRGLNELESLVDQAKASIAFALTEATMDDLLTVADNHEIMPPKSTWFEPKLLSGLFLYDLESN